MTRGFYICRDLYSYEREITLNPEYWVCGGERGWWLVVVVVVVVVVDISRYFPIETDWCPSQHFHHQTSQHPPRHPANLAMLDSGDLPLNTPQSSPDWLSSLEVKTLSLLSNPVAVSTVQHYELERPLVGGWGGSRQIFYHNYLLNQAVSPSTSHSPAVME